MKTRTLLLTALATGLMTASVIPAYAAPSDENNFYSTILTQIKNSVVSIENTVNLIAKMMVEAPKDIGTDITAWASMNKLTQLQSQYTKVSADALDASFNSDDTLAKSVNRAYNINTSSTGGYSGLSAYSLLGLTHTVYQNHDYYTKTYSTDQAKAAGNYIKFLAGTALPVDEPDGNTLKDKEQINLIRTMQAVQSLNAYNLSKLYTSRLPIASTSALKLSGMGTPEGMISKEGLLKYLLQSKVNNPAWYTQMSTASPFAAARESTFLLAAAVSELYRMEQNQEQMILTQTATNTATLAMAKTMMMQMQQASNIANRAKQH